MNTSKTSINKDPVLFRLVKEIIGWTSGKINLDYGAGKYHNMKKLLKKENIKCFEYDRYNKEECPMSLADIYDQRPFDTITLSNVLNTCNIRERNTIYRRVAQWGSVGYISVYEGNRSGVGAATTKGYQENKKTEDYIDELKKVFTSVEKFDKLIVVK